MAARDYLLDVSRLVWRVWAGRLPTGIDRVCLAYLEHFGSRSRAVVQRKQWRRILSPAASDDLFALLLRGGDEFRRAMAGLFLRAQIGQARGAHADGQLYLNVGHTGLDHPGLPQWAPRANVRPVYLLHDLIPITHPEFCRPGEAARHGRRMRNALVSAAGIIGNSQATLHELERFASSSALAMPPTLSAWIGSHHIGRCPPLARAHPYFVVLGTIEGRKNHQLLLQLWRRMAEAGGPVPELIVIGQRGWEAQGALAMLDRLPVLTPHVTVLERCSDAELAACLRGAAALLLPSFAEGFGMPLVEALGAGVPVIASNLPVFRELAGDIPEYLDPLDGPGWLEAIRSYAAGGGPRDRQLVRLKGFEQPGWRGHFEKVEPWLNALGT